VRQRPFSFQEFFGGEQCDPAYAQIFVEFDPNKQTLSKLIELIERFQGELKMLEVMASSRPGLRVVRCKLDNQDVNHIVIALIGELYVEAHGCGPMVAPGRL
jgi:hypothetical protein